jgi:predicted ATPase
MDVRQIEIEGYRSIRRLALPVERLNVFVCENGVGKTNLYRGLELIQAAARGTASLAAIALVVSVVPPPSLTPRPLSLP